jgi:predicted phage tail protein
MLTEPRLGAGGALPVTTVTGKSFDYPNVTIRKIGGYRIALDPVSSKEQDDAIAELTTLIEADAAPPPVAQTRRVKSGTRVPDEATEKVSDDTTE